MKIRPLWIIWAEKVKMNPEKQSCIKKSENKTYMKNLALKKWPWKSNDVLNKKVEVKIKPGRTILLNKWKWKKNCEKIGCWKSESEKKPGRTILCWKSEN